MEKSTAPAGLRQYYVAVATSDAKLTTLVELLQALKVDTRLAFAVACSSRDSVDAVVHALASCSSFNIAVLHSDLQPHDVEQQVLQVKRRLQPPQHMLLHTGGLQQHSAELPQQGEQQTHAAAAAAAAPNPAPQATPPAAAAAAVGGSSNGEPAPPTLLAGVPQQPPLPAAAAAAAWDDDRSIALVASDSCLKGLSKDLTPLGLPLLIQYDLPTSKDVLSRRLAAVFGSSKERGRVGRQAGRQVVIDFVAAGEVSVFRARERLSSAPVLEMPVHVSDVFL